MANIKKPRIRGSRDVRHTSHVSCSMYEQHAGSTYEKHVAG